jgi:hypothetical protein
MALQRTVRCQDPRLGRRASEMGGKRTPALIPCAMRRAFLNHSLMRATVLAWIVCFCNQSAFAYDGKAGLLPAGASPPEWGWRCSGRFEVDGQGVSIWRDFDASGTINPYFIQSFNHEPHGTSWIIDPRRGGHSTGKSIPWKTGRAEAAVLSEGPDYVHINYQWHTEVVGPIYAYFWGDGRYVGAEQLFTSRQARRFTAKDGKMGGLSGGLSQGSILRELYKTETWAFSATDANGKKLTEGTFHPPDLAHSVNEYRRVRAQIENLEAKFRGDYQEQEEGDTTCTAQVDPASEI